MNLQDIIKAQNENQRKYPPSIPLKPEHINLELTYLWNSNSEDKWNLALEKYWKLVKTKNIIIEEKMEKINSYNIKNLSPREFYDFLYYEYFVWKYTAKNRLATTRMHLKRYQIENRLDDLDKIKKEIFNFELEDIKHGLEIVSSIHGLGIAGASGLLALLFPENFGTVDQFVVKDLLSIKGIIHLDLLHSIYPESLKLKDGVELIMIMKRRAEELNKANNTNKWTPRHIDKILWAFRN